MKSITFLQGTISLTIVRADIRRKTFFVEIHVRETSTRVFLPQPKKVNLEITGLVFQE